MKRLYEFFSHRFRLKQEGIWCDVDMQNSSILEIHFPVEHLVVSPIIKDNADISRYKLKDELIIEPTLECTAQLLALNVDHIDILLEDWYPTLGTRFVHTSEGKFLITRLIPCPRCLHITDGGQNLHDFPPSNSQQLLDVLNQDNESAAIGFNDLHRIRKSQESYTSCDSGVEPDSSGSSRIPSLEGYPGLQGDEQEKPIFYSWTVEECILAAYGTKTVACPTHGDVSLAKVAPDTVSKNILLYGIHIT